MTSRMLAIGVISLLLVCTASSASATESFSRCLAVNSYNSSTSDVLYLPSGNASYYESLWRSPIFNLRYATSSTRRPSAIVIPTHESHVQATIHCADKHGLELKTRSGGHDTEGLSVTAGVPFVLLDIRNFRSISIHVANRTARVQSGATLGEVYYNIAMNSRTLAFPAGFCPSVGAGGHFSGGGYGMLIRKFGLAADNVENARIVVADGRILDRFSMGEDLFWAIRGGGGASFGVILEWEIRLLPVPATVTAFQITRNTTQNVTHIFHRWQYVAPNFPSEMNNVIFVTSNAATNGTGRSLGALFQSLYLGKKDEMLGLINDKIPELGLTPDECIEMSWIQSVLFFAGFRPDDPIERLLVRDPPTSQGFFAGKSDYVTRPVSRRSLEGIWARLEEEDPSLARFAVIAFGGRMSEIAADSTPFPHRAGYLYEIYSSLTWEEDDEIGRHVGWLRGFYDYLAPFVSKSPRSAYLNYRDLDLGTNGDGRRVSYRRATRWGRSYFNANFERLVKVKTAADPTNIFRNKQSIPSLAALL